ncbi:hypothetical protein BJY52DRAFT_1284504 [Lactarius psammicola]|nr:hypothetical protein BJY52DRAFT_1284504 [Lactarius psammicola]
MRCVRTIADRRARDWRAYARCFCRTSSAPTQAPCLVTGAHTRFVHIATSERRSTWQTSFPTCDTCYTQSWRVRVAQDLKLKEYLAVACGRAGRVGNWETEWSHDVPYMFGWAICCLAFASGPCALLFSYFWSSVHLQYVSSSSSMARSRSVVRFFR